MESLFCKPGRQCASTGRGCLPGPATTKTTLLSQPCPSSVDFPTVFTALCPFPASPSYREIWHSEPGCLCHLADKVLRRQMLSFWHHHPDLSDRSLPLPSPLQALPFHCIRTPQEAVQLLQLASRDTLPLPPSLPASPPPFSFPSDLWKLYKWHLLGPKEKKKKGCKERLLAAQLWPEMVLAFVRLSVQPNAHIPLISCICSLKPSTLISFFQDMPSASNLVLKVRGTILLNSTQCNVLWSRLIPSWGSDRNTVFIMSVTTTKNNFLILYQPVPSPQNVPGF